MRVEKIRIVMTIVQVNFLFVSLFSFYLSSIHFSFCYKQTNKYLQNCQCGYQLRIALSQMQVRIFQKSIFSKVKEKQYFIPQLNRETRYTLPVVAPRTK